MLYACIALPQLALDDVLRRRPEDPRRRPLVLVEGPAQLRTLHAVDAAAAAAGLAPGMRLSAAHALLAGIDAVEHDPGAEARCQRLLAAWAYRHSSVVSLQWPGAIVLEVRASFRLFGPWPVFARRLRDELDALGFRHAIALAPAPRAALAFASLRDGFAVTSAHAMRAALARVPACRAGLPGDAGERLQRMGLRTLGEIRALPRASLHRRFGTALCEHLDRLHGEIDDPLDTWAPPDHFDARIELGWEVDSHPPLLFPLRRLTADLAAFASARDGGVQRFLLRLEHETGHHDVPVGLLSAERDPAMLFELARGRLQQAVIDRPVVALRLVARGLPPFVPAARDLFDARPAQAQPWPQLRERLRARLGDDAVHRVACTPDPRPERGWRRAGGGADEDAACAAPVPPRPPRPAWLLPTPVPLRDPRPRIVSGPERLESGWWDGDDARRDYYVVETSAGQRAWVYAPPGEQGSWMLHGWFG